MENIDVLWVVAVVLALLGVVGYMQTTAYTRTRKELVTRYAKGGIDLVKGHPAVKQVRFGTAMIDWYVQSYIPELCKFVNIGFWFPGDPKWISTHVVYSDNPSSNVYFFVEYIFRGKSVLKNNANVVLVEVDAPSMFPWQLPWILIDITLLP